ncbi:MAG: ABC transporter ATP-binding protein [Candidatus Caldatribacteriaceae bacterium]
MTSGPILKAERLRAFYVLDIFGEKRTIKAVNGVDLEVLEDEVYGIAGESGCGKTTTARMILGFEYPTEGEIIYRGKGLKEQKDRWSWFREVQAVFQNPFETFNSLRKVEEYFFDAVLNYRLAQDRKRAREYIDAKLKTVGLSFEEISGKYPAEFSGGRLQRISIARALLTNPSLLVADEPVSMVDASLRMSIVNLFRKLCDSERVSVIYITHDLVADVATAYYVSDRIAIMFRGNVVEMGKVEDVLQNPRHPYTKLLLASILEPDPHKKCTEKVTLLEESEEYLKKGCKFAGRCKEADDICREKMPKEAEVEGVLVRCHKYGKS